MRRLFSAEGVHTVVLSNSRHFDCWCKCKENSSQLLQLRSGYFLCSSGNCFPHLTLDGDKMALTYINTYCDFQQTHSRRNSNVGHSSKNRKQTWRREEPRGRASLKGVHLGSANEGQPAGEHSNHGQRALLVSLSQALNVVFTNKSYSCFLQNIFLN